MKAEQSLGKHKRCNKLGQRQHDDLSSIKGMQIDPKTAKVCTSGIWQINVSLWKLPSWHACVFLYILVVRISKNMQQTQIDLCSLDIVWILEYNLNMKLLKEGCLWKIVKMYARYAHICGSRVNDDGDAMYERCGTLYSQGLNLRQVQIPLEVLLTKKFDAWGRSSTNTRMEPTPLDHTSTLWFSALLELEFEHPMRA